MMSFRNLRSLGVVLTLTALTLSYQNCARTNFAINDGLKEAKLAGTPALGGVVDTGDDTGTPGSNDTGNDSPTTPSNPTTPGQDTPMTPPGTVPPGSDTPTTPNPTTPGGTDTPVTNKKYLDIEYDCPVVGAAYNNLLSKSSRELKMVFISGFQTCEIKNVRAQVLAKKVDITACASSVKSSSKSGIINPIAGTEIFLVDNDYNGTDYYNNTFTMLSNMLHTDGEPLRVAYEYVPDGSKSSGMCDEVGDPLLVQLSSKSGQADPINLTSAEKGVMFDLLGRRNKYEKVQTAWFADNKTENYFLVLPDNDGAVKGIDQLFGDATFGPDKHYSKQGFQALAKYDANKDKVISVDDAVFSSLRLWKDDNLDGIAQEKELFSLDEKGVVAIDLRFDRKYKERDQYGNTVKYKSIVVMKDNSYGLIFDLWLKYIQK